MKKKIMTIGGTDKNINIYCERGQDNRLTYDAFFELYPRFKSLKYDCALLPDLFGFILKNEKAMIEAVVKNDLPPLCGLLPAIENYHSPERGLDLENNIFLRQCIGALVGEIMKNLNFFKVGNRNISPKISKFFSAGALYKPVEWIGMSGNKVVVSPFFIPDYQSQKKYAHDFAAAENLSGKIIAAITPGPEMMIFEKQDCTLSSTSDLTEFSEDYDASGYYFESIRPDKIFFTAAQIALEIEARQPGIIAASGLKFASLDFEPSAKAMKRYYFFVELIDELLQILVEKKICEKRLLIDWFSPVFTCSFDNRYYMPEPAGGGVPVYRLAPVNSHSVEAGTAAGISVDFNELVNERQGQCPPFLIETENYEGRINDFNADLVSCIIQSLEKAAADFSGGEVKPVAALYQLSISAAEMQYSPGYVFHLKHVEKSFFHKVFHNPRCFEQDRPIFTAGLSLRHINFFAFSYTADRDHSIEPAGRFILLAALE